MRLCMQQCVDETHSCVRTQEHLMARYLALSAFVLCLDGVKGD